jgi:Ca2+-binding RTX toxin-like protein
MNCGRLIIMTITVNVLSTLGSDPDLYTFLGFIDGAGNDEDPVLNDTSTKFNAEVSLLDGVFVTTGTGFTYDKFGRTLGTGLVTSSTIVEGGVSMIRYTHSTPVKLQDIINGVTLFASGFDPVLQMPAVGQPYSFYDDHRTTYLLDKVYMFDNYVYTGNIGDDTFTAGFLDDKLDGKAGNDELYGLSGDDSIIGGAGDDALYGGNGDDTIDGGAGNDTLVGGGQDFTGDWVTYASAAAAVTVDLSNASAQNTGGAGTDTISEFENLLGSNFNDTLTGNAGDNFIEGGAGNDIIDGGGQSFIGDFAFYTKAAAAVHVSLGLLGSTQNTGGAGTDTLIGIEGLTGSKFNDTLLGNSADNGLDGYFGNDVINGGDGNDTVYYVFANKGVKVDLSITTAQNTVGEGIDTITNVENVWGSFFSDKLSGTSGANFILGLDGNDVIKGGDGADTLDGAQGRDTVSYAGSSVGVQVDLNLQGVGPQVSTGDANGDVLNGFEDIIGSSLNDTLIGDGFSNAIDGGDGNDIMTGGGGADFFRFANNAFTDGDSITDFTLGEDKIDLALIDAKANIAGNQTFTFIGTDAFTKVGQLRFEYDSGNDQTVIQGNDSNANGTAADFEIRLTGNLTLTKIDFIL